MPSVIALVTNGSPQLSEAQKSILINEYARNEGKEVVIKIEHYSEARTRTLKSNAFYWGVVLTEIAAETGHTTEELHEFFREKFLPRKFISVAGEEQEIGKSTTTLSTEEFTVYIDRIIEFAGTNLNMTISPANND